MVDAGGGNGVLQQLNKVNVSLSDIHKLFLTHAHTDHVLGAVWVGRLVMQLMRQDKYNGVLHIWGHDKFPVQTCCCVRHFVYMRIVIYSTRMKSITVQCLTLPNWQANCM